MSDSDRQVYISYAWGGESERVANEIDASLGSSGIAVVRDKRDLGYKGSIQDFMQDIGRGHAVVVVICDKYLKSPNCMFELVEIVKNDDVRNRIFPVVLQDADIYDPVKRIRYIKHWEEKLEELDKAMRSVSAAHLQGLREEIDSYHEIRDHVSRLTFLLKDMNTLTPEMHENSNFSRLVAALESRVKDAAAPPTAARAAAVAVPAAVSMPSPEATGTLKRLGDVAEQDAVAATIASPEGVYFDCSHGQDGWAPVSPVPHLQYSAVGAAAAKRASVHSDAVEITAPLLARLSAYVLPIGPGQGSHRPLSPSEVQALVRFAKSGGGLLLLGAYTGDWHHRWNMNDVARSFGLRFNVDAVTSSGAAGTYSEVNAHYPDERGAFVAVPATGGNAEARAGLLAGVARVAVASCCTLAGATGNVMPLLVADSAATRWEPEPTGFGVNIRKYTPGASAQPAVVMAASLEHRVLAVGSWKLFTDAFMAAEGFDNARLFENALAWLTAR